MRFSALLSLGCRLIEGSGSRVRFEKEGLVAAFHGPNPERQAKRYQVGDARAYLQQLGVTKP
ncbi:type II toxin-antitoxin system HicA family toxin [Metarhizobium album]|uniref:type II toxin-antitoxin system HicA family toxin n=1 Tax=Metarhizobium album TaxID=2182425 RepID=UPI001FE1942C|nr:type II toxin-antitoxin system HicA family toxin [Rhizobium album]